MSTTVSIEKSLLAWCMIDEDVLRTCLEKLGCEDFGSSEGADLYSTIASVWMDYGKVDINLIDVKVKDSDELKSFFDDTVKLCAYDVGDYEEYIAILKDSSVKNKVYDLMVDSLEKLKTKDGVQVMNFVQDKMIQIGSEIESHGFKRPTDFTTELFNPEESDVKGLTTGFPTLDDRIPGGLKPGDFVLIAGRPSMGKSELMVNIARHISYENNSTSAIFSLEMTAEVVLKRLLSSVADVPFYKLLIGKYNADEKKKMDRVKGVFLDAPIFIDDTSSLDTLELLGKVTNLKLKAPDLAVAFVDYLQLMEGVGEEGREREIASISRGLKVLAGKLGIVVIALSQLSRACEQRPNKKPIKSDLRESGALEQDADLILFCYRPYEYSRLEEEKSEMEIIIGKQRNGPVGIVSVENDLETQTITDLSSGFRTLAVEEEGNVQAQNGNTN